MRGKDYEQCLRVWPDEYGRLAAFGEWTESENQCVLDLQLHPAHSADGTGDRVRLWAETESAGRPIMVVVAPDGRFAATCNCWLDERSGAGLFEPVSTAPAHRRKGLGQILVSFGLHQLRSLGARSAWIASDSGNPDSTRLYERCGLSVVRRDYDYVRQAPRLPL